MPLARSFSEAKAQVEQLVERFDRNRDVYTRPEYKEAQTRVEFIDPLFEALVCFAQFIEQLPIRTIGFDDPTGVARHENVVALVEGMLDLHKKLAAASASPTRRSTSARSRPPTGRSMRWCRSCTG